MLESYRSFCHYRILGGEHFIYPGDYGILVYIKKEHRHTKLPVRWPLGRPGRGGIQQPLMTIRGHWALQTCVHVYEKSTGQRCSVRPEEVYEDMEYWEKATCADGFPKWSVYEAKIRSLHFRQKMSCSDKKIAETDQLYTKLHDCYSRKVIGSSAVC